MQPRYVVYPGRVESPRGQIHYLGFFRLCRLYGVDAKICINAGNRFWRDGRDPDEVDTLIPLSPRYDGDYTLPTGDVGGWWQ